MYEFEFGISRKIINPPMKMGLAGYFNTRIWTDVLDDLEVRAAAFRSRGKLSFLIQYDLIVCPPELFQMVRERLQCTELKECDLLVTATHCHTAPEVRRGRGGFCAEYLTFAADQTLEAIREAVKDLSECISTETGYASNAECCFNRRFWMKDGSVQTNPGKLNPDILRPEGEIDPEIPLFRLKNKAGRTLLLASICNHADTTGGNLVSGDWPGWTRRIIESEMKNGDMMMPLIGCSGDINHFDVTIPGDQTSPEEAERIGRSYAESIKLRMNSLKNCNASFVSRCTSFQIPSREIFQEELAEAEEILEKYKDIVFTADTAKSLTAEDFAKKTPVVLKYFAEALMDRHRNPQQYTFEISLFDFGSAVIIGVPCEPFTATGLILRKQIFFGKTALVAILNNGSGTGYFPNLWNYGRGGYETTPRSNQFSIHAAEKVLAAAELIK
ncbi:MAG: hypothetical protein IJW05_05865 [Lentisphaeria bacterium]|nr:hypothetical protein [Lentisphaeria bacterium]